MKSILAIAFLLSLGNCALTLVKHPIETGARCLDGSEAALYYALGSPANRTKFLIYFSGGGLCKGLTLADTLEDCYKRSFGGLGSSLNYPPTTEIPNESMLSEDAVINPAFHDWTKVLVPYCDGSEHQGSRREPVPYKGRDLYFRGMNNSIQQFAYLNSTLGLYAADIIALSGTSAGAIATFEWSNYLYERSLNKQVFAVPDSGLFVPEYINPVTGRADEIDRISNLVKLVNTEVKFPIPQCSDDFADNPAICFSAGHLAQYLKAPFFIIASQYDAWSVENILGLNCTKTRPGTMTDCNASEIAVLEDYRKTTMVALRNLTTLKTVGIWSPSCIQHGFTAELSYYSEKYLIPSGTGISLAKAINAFLLNPSGQHIYIDDFGWPANSGCSGLAAPVFQ